MLFELLGHVRAQLVNVELGGIDHQVGNRANRLQMAPLRPQRSLHRSVNAQRVRPAGFAEAAQQGFAQAEADLAAVLA